eukprot:1707247-Lingulodinium_polyedra.AAC.1
MGAGRARGAVPGGLGKRPRMGAGDRGPVYCPALPQHPPAPSPARAVSPGFPARLPRWPRL